MHTHLFPSVLDPTPLPAPFPTTRPPQMEVLLPMTVRFANPIQCGGSWGFARYHGFFT